ncbi:hypothetical protein [Janthinobacterium sp. MDB2-8]|uniref:hypothetical protein n=1 Tax=Janthinobacterium sp. MDB2-8 TaxID=1259338 RepID=UPI003F25EDA0
MEENQKKYKCGLIMPIAAIDNCPASHWEAVRLIIKEALEDTEYEVSLVSDSNEIGIIQKRIVQNTFSNDMVICDVSAKNPNVMFELGMRLAFDKPVLIIKDDFTNYSFDTGVIEHINYPRDLNYHAIQQFKTLLRTKLIATHKATTEPGYSSFLASFSTVTASKLPEKEVGSMDYILEAMSEMRDEIRSLTQPRIARLPKTVSIRMPLPPHKKFIQHIRATFKNFVFFNGPSDPKFREIYNDFFRSYYPSINLSEEEFEGQLITAYDEYMQMPSGQGYGLGEES